MRRSRDVREKKIGLEWPRGKGEEEVPGLKPGRYKGDDKGDDKGKSTVKTEVKGTGLKTRRYKMQCRP